MKYLKTILVAIIAVCTFGTTQAQVRVQIGGHPHRVYHRRVVVVRHHHYVRHHDYHRHY